MNIETSLKAATFFSLDPEGLNGGVPPAVVASLPRTPVDHLFTRSHAPPPIIDPETWRLRNAKNAWHRVAVRIRE